MRASVVLLSCVAVAVWGYSCQDESGKDVDWWVVYKLPHLTKSTNPNAASGYGYAYADANSPTLTLTDEQLDKNIKGAVGSTLAPIYEKSQAASFMYAMYNDQLPNGTDPGANGHTKGVIGFDSDSGFWLVHSIPSWPPVAKDGYSFPTSSKVYGQSMLCMSLSTDTLDVAAGHMMLNYPAVYDHGGYTSKYTNISNIIAGVTQKTAAAVAGTLKSSGGNTFIQFAKNTAWNQDLYESLVSPYFDSGMRVETWMRPYLPSFCPPQYKYASENIRWISFDNSTGVEFNETNDHSKWGQTLTGGWTCIGDINHQLSQYKRGGGTVCFQNSKIYSSYAAIVTQVSGCKKTDGDSGVVAEEERSEVRNEEAGNVADGIREKMRTAARMLNVGKARH